MLPILPLEIVDLIMFDPQLIVKSRLTHKKYHRETDFQEKMAMTIKHFRLAKGQSLLASFVIDMPSKQNIRHQIFHCEFPKKLSDYRFFPVGYLILKASIEERITLSNEDCALLDSFIPSRPFGEITSIIWHMMKMSHATDNKFVCYCWNKYSRPYLMPRILYDSAMSEW